MSPGIVIVVIATAISSAVTAAASRLMEEEAKGWLEAVPGIVLRAAAMHLGDDQRVTVYREEWLPELLFIARKADGRPITRFLTCVRYSLGLLRASRRIARDLRRAQRRELTRIEPAHTPAQRLKTVQELIAEQASAPVGAWPEWSPPVVGPGIPMRPRKTRPGKLGNDPGQRPPLRRGRI